MPKLQRVEILMIAIFISAAIAVLINSVAPATGQSVGNEIVDAVLKVVAGDLGGASKLLLSQAPKILTAVAIAGIGTVALFALGKYLFHLFD